jgi:hypothetical protein
MTQTRTCRKCRRELPLIKFGLAPRCESGRRFVCRWCQNGAPKRTRERWAERFWARVERGATEQCWEWTGALDTTGYGRMMIARKIEGSHRISWRLHTGQEIPDGMHICHTCDNRKCVNPLHLFVGTPAENAFDMIAKGRNVVTPRKAQCMRGHALVPGNLYTKVWRSKTVRSCRQCALERSRVAKQRARSAGSPPR